MHKWLPDRAVIIQHFILNPRHKFILKMNIPVSLTTFPSLEGNIEEMGKEKLLLQLARTKDRERVIS